METACSWQIDSVSEDEFGELKVIIMARRIHRNIQKFNLQEPKQLKRTTANTDIRSDSVDVQSDDTKELLARGWLDPAVQAAMTVRGLDDELGELTIEALGRTLQQQVEQIKADNLDRPEAMLINQAHTLDTIYNTLVRRSAQHMGQQMEAAETYMKLALRAQSQCRSTLEALNEMKHPRHVSFVRQANIAGGHQQINNSVPNSQDTDSRTGKTENQPSKVLSEVMHGSQLDAGAPSTPIKSHTAVETLGVVNRTKDSQG